MIDARIHDVTDTAILVAAGRARESARADALFRDPFAAKLVGPRGEAMVKKTGWSYGLEWTMSVRTVLIDEYVRKAIAEGCDTVVNLGCGLDTRPYRMDLPQDLRWIEVDFPKIISYKESLLADEKARCRLERHAADLSALAERKAVLKTIASQAKKALVITEGVVPYLSNEDAAALADDLRAEPCFRLWIVDYITDDVMKRVQTRRVKKRMGSARLLFRPADWKAFFASHGWNIRDLRFLADEGQRIGRPFKKKFWVYVLALFMTKKKFDRLMHAVGYALLEAQR